MKKQLINSLRGLLKLLEHDIKKTIESSGESVMQDWTVKLDFKIQTVLIQSLRAPDTHYCKDIKKVCRWIRSVVLQNADEDHTFMKLEKLPDYKSLEDELGYCSLHYVTHLLYGLQIIGYKHHDDKIKKIAYKYYINIVTDTLHLNKESEASMDKRLADKEIPKVGKEVEYKKKTGKKTTTRKGGGGGGKQTKRKELSNVLRTPHGYWR